jgi:hypothetical protein
MGRRRRELVWNEALGDWEKECARCHELWPADEEFYYQAPASSTGLSSYCRACVTERNYELRGGKSGWEISKEKQSRGDAEGAEEGGNLHS